MGFIPNSVTRYAARAVLTVTKHAPTILFAGGVTGVVATTVLASKATLQLPEILDDVDGYVEAINDTDQTEKEKTKDKAYLYFRTSLRIGRLYLPSVVLGSLSVAALTGSHRILTTRNAALTAAYTTLDKGFREYRSRVVDELGAEKDREFRRGTHTEKVTTVDEVTGKKTTTEEKVDSGIADYGRLFDDQNANWCRNDPDSTLLFIKLVQNASTQRLQAKGFLLLNDVYDALGLERTKDGAVVGWVVDGENSDGYVDFGIFNNGDNNKIFDFLTESEKERGIWLDFNVDGLVYDQIDRFRAGQ